MKPICNLGKNFFKFQDCNIKVDILNVNLHVAISSIWHYIFLKNAMWHFSHKQSKNLITRKSSLPTCDSHFQLIMRKLSLVTNMEKSCDSTKFYSFLSICCYWIFKTLYPRYYKKIFFYFKLFLCQCYNDRNQNYCYVNILAKVMSFILLYILYILFHNGCYNEDIKCVCHVTIVIGRNMLVA